MYRKTEQITIRVNPILKDKFIVAIWFLDLSAVLSEYMQTYIRKYEKDIWQKIPIRTDKQGAYDIITNLHWIKISKERYNSLSELYPKSRKDAVLYWPLK